MDIQKKELKKRLVKNSFWNFITLLVNRIGALIFTVLLARFLLPKGFGIYSIVLSTSMIFYTFADLGVNQALLKYVSSSLAKDKKRVASYYRYLLKIKFSLILASSFILLAAAYPLSAYIFNNIELFPLFLIASAYVFIFSLENFYGQLFFSIEKVNYYSTKEAIGEFLRIILALFVFFFIASSFHLIGIFLTLILSSLFLLAFSVFYTKKLCPIIYSHPEKDIQKKNVLKFVGFLTIASISSVFFSHIDSIMLGIFLPEEYVGYYRAAFSLVVGLISFISFPNAILLPVFSKLDKSRIQTILNRTFNYMSILSIPAIFGIFILGNYFIELIYGASYLPATILLKILSLLAFPTAGIGLIVSVFSAEEKPEIFAKLIVIACVLNIVLNFVFIKLFLTISSDWATAGVAIATLISWFFYFFASVFFSKKNLQIQLYFKSIIKPIIASTIMSIILLFSVHFIDQINYISLILEVVLGALVYFACLLIIKGIKKEDFDLLKILIKK